LLQINQCLLVEWSKGILVVSIKRNTILRDPFVSLTPFPMVDGIFLLCTPVLPPGGGSGVGPPPSSSPPTQPYRKSTIIPVFNTPLLMHSGVRGPLNSPRGFFFSSHFNLHINASTTTVHPELMYCLKL
jgi:hypothetical protein